MSVMSDVMHELWRAHVEIVEDIADWCGDIWDRFRANTAHFFADVTLKDWVEIFYATVFLWMACALLAWVLPW